MFTASRAVFRTSDVDVTLHRDKHFLIISVFLSQLAEGVNHYWLNDEYPM